eukprot:TRINITY_DN35293_c0_g1_i1.p1 TRINITY_DN35293_c0_g1~~TRINITY_DN35293_c0_g1_i1.p1  ORF type:complete len:104 (+),score=12.85 TRINITY_DN35293_c0_g1_i1:30-341(+)
MGRKIKGYARADGAIKGNHEEGSIEGARGRLTCEATTEQAGDTDLWCRARANSGVKFWAAREIPHCQLLYLLRTSTHDPPFGEDIDLSHFGASRPKRASQRKD